METPQKRVEPCQVVLVEKSYNSLWLVPNCLLASGTTEAIRQWPKQLQGDFLWSLLQISLSSRQQPLANSESGNTHLVSDQSLRPVWLILLLLQTCYEEWGVDLPKTPSTVVQMVICVSHECLLILIFFPGFYLLWALLLFPFLFCVNKL